MKDKRGYSMPLSYLTWLILALFALVVAFIAFTILTGKASSGIDWLKSLLRFGA